MPLTFRIRNDGSKAVTFLTGDFLEPLVETDAQWRARPQSSVKVINGPLPVVELAPGGTYDEALDLVSHFSSFTAGVATVELTVAVRAGDQDDHVLVRLAARCEVTLT